MTKRSKAPIFMSAGMDMSMAINIFCKPWNRLTNRRALAVLNILRALSKVGLMSSKFPVPSLSVHAP